MYGRRIAVLALRDLVVLGLTVGLMRLDASLRAEAVTGVLPALLAGATGLAITVCGFYAHEWGHYLAARGAGATPVPSASPLSIFLFALGEDACSRRQWLAMSAGGYVASIVGLAVILSVIDLGTLSGRVALGLTSLGVLATFALEMPITLRVYRKSAA